MKSLKEINKKVLSSFNRNIGSWLREYLAGGTFYFEYPLGIISEKLFESDRSLVISWAEEIRVHFECYIEPKTYQWKRSVQTLPYRLKINSLFSFVELVNKVNEVEKQIEKLKIIQAKNSYWLDFSTALYTDFLRLSIDDVHILLKVLSFILNNPNSKLYSRQVPIEGVHGKWIEQHKPIIKKMLQKIHNTNESNFYKLTGFLSLPSRLRLRLLCPDLVSQYRGITDLEVTVGDLGSCRLFASNVMIIENLVSGLCLPNMSDTIVIFKLGYKALELKDLPLLKNAERIVYWGDCDKAGLDILNKLRGYFKHVESIMMDSKTFDNFSRLGSKESKQQYPSTDNLTNHELLLLESISENEKLEFNNQLEQEFIPWEFAQEVIFKKLQSSIL